MHGTALGRRHQAAPVGALGVLRRGVVVDGLDALGRLADGLRVVLLDVLRREADLRLVRPLVLELDDLLAVVGAADLGDVFLDALVREERRRRAGDARRRAAVERAAAVGDVREELGNLERVALLLLVLV